MPKQIQETITRWCCQSKDLVALPGAPLTWINYREVPSQRYCKYCLEIFKYATWTDPAGSRDSGFIETGTFYDLLARELHDTFGT